ncbi:TonB-dependent receptor plug domain-containing protein [Rufibacter roseus]|uniref:TonB-dependent receptor plug domain-containing protein n=1 Tax=Rufibacter roseus TaxID=1567108 RepID=A0ABW2DPF4_9BACT|nr:TonB-dependent receptor [Rufibacter roseus]
MVHRLVCFVIAFVAAELAGAPGICAQSLLSDSVQLTEVTIAARRYEHFSAGTRTLQVDSLLLQRQPGLTLADVLQQRTPLYLRSYGNGMTATVAFRGTASSHTAVLWNGFNIALPTLGMSDFALLPPQFSTQVSLQHGPSGALHGSGAVGGAVILENPASFTYRQQVRVQQEVGSFGHHRTAASGSYSNRRISLSSSFSRTSSENDFRFQNTAAFGKPWERQQNAAFRQTSFAQDIHYKLSPDQQVSVRAWYVNTHRQIQPAMGSANSNARQEDENLRLMAEWAGRVAGGRTSVRAAYFTDRLDYQDNSILSLSKVNTLQSQVEHERNLLPHLLLQVGTEGQLFRADVGGYGGEVEEYRFSGYAWLRYDPTTKLQLSLNLRQALVNGYNPPITPTLGANYLLLEESKSSLTAKANISRSYRVPTLNDRFWSPGGNPNLQPENGWGYEASLLHQYKNKKVTGTTEATVYALQVHDWIQWQPASGGYSEPVNLSKVKGHGAEIDSKWQWQPATQWTLLGGLAYAYTISEQKLPNAWGELQERQLFYVPKHKLASWVDFRFRDWFLTADATFTDLRFTDNDNNNWLPAYTLVNTGLGKTFDLRRVQVQVMAQVQNATNTVYQTMAYRAMPPRNFRLSLAVLWNRFKSQ